jgi:hypothetical protein
MSIKAYPYPVRPEKHPLYTRRQVKAVTSDQLGGKIRFIALRWFERDETGLIININRTLDLYTKVFQLCDVIWPEYTFLFAPNFKEVVDALAERGLYVFDFWGYVPGSGRTADNMWAEYQPPEEVYQYLCEKLGDHFIGFDNGEQDGRYIYGYAPQMCPAYGDRKRQYLNFQRHFQKLGDHMHNYTTVLASLMSLHYFAKDDNVLMLGAETPQALPSTNMWFSFIRGAGKQYGLLWYGNASVFNRWGFKSYFMSTDGKDSYEKGDPENGASLSLLKRILYTEYMYNSAMLGYDMGWLNDDHQCACIDPKYCIQRENEFLNPLGIVQERLYHFVEKHGSPGILYTPVCLYAGFFNGWQPPRHLYTQNIYTAWGNRPYTGGDHQLHRLLDLIYPGYNDCSYFRDERGFLTATPFGDLADVLLDDARQNLLNTYRLMLVCGDGDLTYESYRKILRFAQNGGQVVLTADKLENSPVGKIDPDFLLPIGILSLTRQISHTGYDVTLSNDVRVVAEENGIPLISETRLGQGKISVIYVPCGIEPTGCRLFQDHEPKVYDGKRFNPVEKSIPELYRLVPAVQQYLSECLDGTVFLRPTSRDLQYTVNIIDDRTFTMLVANNQYNTIRFDIECLTAAILAIEEQVIEDVTPDTPGYYPPEKYISRDFGQAGQGEYEIAPCDVRIFRVHTGTAAIEIMPEIPDAENNAGLYLTLPDTLGIKDAIIQNPTLLDHFEGLKVQGRYFEKCDPVALAEEAAYARRRGVKIIVDFSSLINHYPDFSFLRNIAGRTEESEQRFAGILQKASLFDCTRALMILQRNAENALDYADAWQNMLITLKNLQSKAASHGVALYVQNGRSLKSTTTANAADFTSEMIKAADCGIKLAFNLCHSLASHEDTKEAIARFAPSALLLSAPHIDGFGQSFDDHLPISSSIYGELARTCVSLLPECDFICLDGVYENFDRVYTDLETLRTGTNEK